MVVTASLLGQGQLVQVWSRQRIAVDLDHNTPPTLAFTPTFCCPKHLLTILPANNDWSERAMCGSGKPLHVGFDVGAKRILLPMASVKDILTIPGELFKKFQTGFYADPSDAVFKALGPQTHFLRKLKSKP